MDKLKENPYYNLEEILKNHQEFTDYIPSEFEDRVVEFPWTFIMKDMGNYTNPITGEVEPIIGLKHFEGEVIADGVPLSEKYLGNVDVGVAVLFEWRKYINAKILEMILTMGGLELGNLNGLISNAFAVTFDNLENIKINKGYYKTATGEVWG